MKAKLCLSQSTSYFLMIIMTLFLCNPVWADANIAPLVDNMEQSKAGMTLWQTIQAGGLIMFVLAGLSVVALTIILYCFVAVNPAKLVPAKFAEDVIGKLSRKHNKAAQTLCEENPNVISNIVLEGLSKQKKGDIFAKEAIENAARKEISGLWQTISYLSDISNIAPLVGLLGTVLGMIQAFNVIAFQSGVVKPILLAGGVSKAMITTAGGLIVAIPIMLFYSFFRGKVQNITNLIETYTADIVQTFESK